MPQKIISAWRDSQVQCLFVRYDNGVIDRYSLQDDNTFRFLGDPNDDRNPDPGGIIWNALTGQRPDETKNSPKHLCEHQENVFAKIKLARQMLYGRCVDLTAVRAIIDEIIADNKSPESSPEVRFLVAHLDRIRAAANKLPIDQGGVRSNQAVGDLLKVIFAL